MTKWQDVVLWLGFMACVTTIVVEGIQAQAYLDIAEQVTETAKEILK